MARSIPELPALVWGIGLACLLPELVLSGADLGLWGTAQWRGYAIGYGGFWPGLLHGWRVNYPGQPWAMFVTYGFLHSGFVHFAVNMVSLASLGRGVVERLGQGGLAWVYGAALLGGALGFAGLANATNPMVGASGALFGLAGALIALAWAERRAAHETLAPVWKVIAGLIAMNVVLWVATGGLLAWQTHLGGFVAGGLAGWVLGGRPGGDRLA